MVAATTSHTRSGPGVVDQAHQAPQTWCQTRAATSLVCKTDTGRAHFPHTHTHRVHCTARSSRSARRAVAATGFGSPGYVAPTTTQAGAIAASVAHAPTTTPRASAVAAASPAAVAGAGAGVVVVGSQQGGAGVPRLLTSQSGPLRPRPSRPAEARTAELEAQLKELQAKLTLEESRSSQLRSRVTTLEVELDKQLETVREIKVTHTCPARQTASILSRANLCCCPTSPAGG